MTFQALEYNSYILGVSGKINTAYGPAAIYIIGCACQTFALLYAIFCVKEYQVIQNITHIF